ncbi:MAG: hypothetical protein CM15mP129_06150 [Chloroflexota bacterium]|nr:MAG: hypothetical protein CM15mP129_06150 [Chloroflexota bacterium]
MRPNIDSNSFAIFAFKVWCRVQDAQDSFRKKEDVDKLYEN